MAPGIREAGPSVARKNGEKRACGRDPYTKAADGQVAVTAVMLWNFAITRAASYALFKMKIA